MVYLCGSRPRLFTQRFLNGHKSFCIIIFFFSDSIYMSLKAMHRLSQLFMMIKWLRRFITHKIKNASGSSVNLQVFHLFTTSLIFLNFKFSDLLGAAILFTTSRDATSIEFTGGSTTTTQTLNQTTIQSSQVPPP